jgi:hypothetical protein
MSDFRTAQQLLEDEKAAKALPSVEDAPLAVRVSGIEAPMVEVLRKTLCADFSPPQFLLYLAICKRKGVDPFTEAYGFPSEEGGLAFGLRIDGMRALAMRTGRLASRKVETVFSEDKPPKLMGARATIQRLGMDSPVIEEAWMGEYARNGFGWSKYPETMIRKCAEAKCLRAAFPDALSGIYEPSELTVEAKK